MPIGAPRALSGSPRQQHGLDLVPGSGGVAPGEHSVGSGYISGTNSALHRPDHASVKKLTPDDMLVPAGFTRGLGVADENAR